MIANKKFVVIKDAKFYKKDNMFVDDLQQAKEFHSKGTARQVAQKLKGQFREVLTSPKSVDDAGSERGN